MIRIVSTNIWQFMDEKTISSEQQTQVIIEFLSLVRNGSWARKVFYVTDVKIDWKVKEFMSIKKKFVSLFHTLNMIFFFFTPFNIISFIFLVSIFWNSRNIKLQNSFKEVFSLNIWQKTHSYSYSSIDVKLHNLYLLIRIFPTHNFSFSFFTYWYL